MLYLFLFILLVGVAVVYLSIEMKKSDSKNSQIKYDWKNSKLLNEFSLFEIKNEKVKGLVDEISKHIIGMDNLVKGVLIGILLNQHVLVEGLPGLAKTRTILAYSKLIDLDFKRIQFTPDLLPSDIIGGEIFDKKEGKFKVFLGPIFTNLLLADEINRATPKVQSALLEAMQEKKVTIAGVDYKLPDIFFVMATQNPLEQDGTFPLPEAQLDRFLFKILVTYPTKEQEKKILDTFMTDIHCLKPILSKDELKQIQEEVMKIPVGDDVKSYIVDIVSLLRESNPDIKVGPSPRASISLLLVGKAIAYLLNDSQVRKSYIEAAILPVLRHRIKLSLQAEVKGKTPDQVIVETLKI